MNLSRKLGRLLGVKIFETSPLQTDTEEPPGYLRENPLQLRYWKKGWALRRELEADLPSTETS